MKKNNEIAEIFFEIADILEMKNVEWKPRAYRQAARAISDLDQPIESLYKKNGVKSLKEIPSVGEHIAKKIEEYLKTGKIKAYEELKDKTISYLDVLMKIPGMGVKKIKKLNSALNIKTIDDLENAAKQHKIAKLPNFGEKSEQDILEGIAVMKRSKGRIPLRKAEKIAEDIISQMKKKNNIEKISTAGSLRRKKSTVGDIDILVSSNDAKSVIDFFTSLKNIQKVYAKGPTRASIALNLGVQVDLRVLRPDEWGAGLLYFTGSKEYNIRLRKTAIKKGLKLSEYGVFDKQTGKRIASKTEKDMCRALGVKYLKPEEREV